MNSACSPLMDAASPHCACPQCRLVRALRPTFPHIVTLRLSPDGRRFAMIHAAEGGQELWVGEPDPLRLNRVWCAADEESFAVPAFSDDGQHACVPLLGPRPGLFVVTDLASPRRLTRGHDVDPRWMGEDIAFYRLVEGRPQPRRVPLAA